MTRTHGNVVNIKIAKTQENCSSLHCSNYTSTIVRADRLSSSVQGAYKTCDIRLCQTQNADFNGM